MKRAAASSISTISSSETECDAVHAFGISCLDFFVMLSNDSCNDPRIQIILQYGNNRENVVLPRSESPAVFESLRARALELVARFSPNMGTIVDLHLFRHNYNSPSMLQHISSVSQLDNGCFVEVIVAERIDRPVAPVMPHVGEPNTYLVPTFCDYCSEMLAGMMKQGVRCMNCRSNFHKRCLNAPRNNCPGAPPGLNRNLAPMPMLPGGIQVPPGSMPGPSSSGLPHTLADHNYRNFTLCKVCNNLLVGIVRQGMKCRDCGVNVHRKCAKDLPENCQLAVNSIQRMSICDTPAPEPESLPENLPSQEDMMDQESTNTNLPLFRLPGQGFRATTQPKVEGWMIHFELSDPSRRLKHYWILANGSINMYHDHIEGVGVNPNRCYKRIPLHEIIAIKQHDGPSVISKNPPHYFEIRTTNNTVYCVGENLHAYSGGPPKKIPRNLSIRPPSNAQLWFQALRAALGPPVSHNDPPNQEPALKFQDLYQIESSQPIGTGQFGTVYTAVQRRTGQQVAVKIIAKERFNRRSNGAEALITEVAILQQTAHEGIVRLEFMCETKDKIYVVMEKMNGDMLEMILSQAMGRLDERVTKFLIVQILSALKYLHDREIAHCDLKPENVLLSEMNTNFPQTKLCDFGYSRFIGDQEFRKTIVGTPAYLPPEVLQKKGYNKSLDMWSVGVIIYVTLSGTFPFNDDQEIANQIQNAEFMFPNEPWQEISKEAIDLIKNLLRVKLNERLQVDECLGHIWLKGGELFSDLRTLETRLNCTRYLTNEVDDVKYAEFLAKQG